MRKMRCIWLSEVDIHIRNISVWMNVHCENGLSGAIDIFACKTNAITMFINLYLHICFMGGKCNYVYSEGLVVLFETSREISIIYPNIVIKRIKVK